MAKQSFGDSLRKRIKDEMKGITGGKVDLHPRGSRPEEGEQLPDISELGVPLPARKEIEQLVAKHAEQGLIISKAKKVRDKTYTPRIKSLIQEQLLEESWKFYSGVNRVNLYKASRKTVDTDAIRDYLLSQGVKPAIIAGALAAGITYPESLTLLVTPPGADDEE